MARLWFIRIGGTAMGGVAAACQQMGDEVFGSEPDLYEPMKSYLAQSGVEVNPKFDADAMTAARPDFIVVGNAVSRGNPELEAAMNLRWPMVSLPQLVRDRLIGQKTSVVVAGTHGKTTTTAMLAWILEVAGRSPGFLIGGVPGNFDVSCRPAAGDVFVSEGDEYDSAFFDKRSKFIHYRPDVAILNNLEFDHSDIFDSLADVKRSFRHFVRLVPSGGTILSLAGDASLEDVLATDAHAPVVRFGFEDGDWRATQIVESAEGVQFALNGPGGAQRISLPMPGRHNALNAVAAAAGAVTLGVPLEAVRSALETFRPPKRRLEVKGDWRGVTVIEDFAHHPTAIAQTIRALRTMYPGRRLWVAFEPRSNTTTRNVFQTELTDALALADGVFLGALDRPHRYTAQERLDVDRLVQELERRGKFAWSVPLEAGPFWGDLVLARMAAEVRSGDVLAVLTNGDFGGLRQAISHEIAPIEAAGTSQ